MPDLVNLKSDVDKLKNMRSNLNNLRHKVDKLDIGKLGTIPTDLSKLSNLVKNDVAKKTEHYELVRNVNAIQTTNTSDLA